MTSVPAKRTTGAPWWQTAVIYQIYPRSFADSNGDGVGDLRGITAKLDYLAGTLGIDAIWVSPFYPSPMKDFGYDVADYCNVDPRFGTLADFDQLLADVHSRNMRIIIDWVPNHSSDQHPWFIESRSSRDNPKRDWYVWVDAKPDGSPPNNWLGVFGGSAWEWDDATGQFYLHSFLESQPDLNWRNPEVKSAMFDSLRFWLDRGVDGFRIDVAHHLMKDPMLRDNPVAHLERSAYFKDLGDYEAFEPVNSKGHEDIHPLFQELRGVIDEYRDRFVVGEIHEWDWQAWARYYGNNLDELHMPFNFSLLYVAWDAAEVRRRVDAAEAALPTGAWPNHVLGNHDESRLATRFGPERARAAALLLLTLRGTPTLYYGDELAMPNVQIPASRQRDPWGLRVPGLGRDGCRTPMQWTSAPGAGFTPPEVEPWLPLGASAATANVETQLATPDSILQLYRRLLELRRSEPALHLGTYRARDDGPDGVYLYERAHADRTAVIAINFSDAGTEVDIGDAHVVVSTHLDRDRVSGSVALRPNEGIVAFREDAGSR